MSVRNIEVTFDILSSKDEELASISMTDEGVFVEINRSKPFSLSEIADLKEGLEECALNYARLL